MSSMLQKSKNRNMLAFLGLLGLSCPAAAYEVVTMQEHSDNACQTPSDSPKRFLVGYCFANDGSYFKYDCSSTGVGTMLIFSDAECKTPAAEPSRPISTTCEWAEDSKTYDTYKCEKAPPKAVVFKTCNNDTSDGSMAMVRAADGVCRSGETVSCENGAVVIRDFEDENCTTPDKTEEWKGDGKCHGVFDEKDKEWSYSTVAQIPDSTCGSLTPVKLDASTLNGGTVSSNAFRLSGVAALLWLSLCW